MTGEKNLRFAGALIDTLAAGGARGFVLSPGSRCTPLTVAAASRPNIKIWRSIDERGAAFFAQGHAKATGKPAVLVCTSGTAAANYLPGIIEASESGVPLVVLTADRPPELRGCGAPQTTDQVKLYGDHVRFFQEAPVPDSLSDPEAAASALALRALASAHSLRGPVHLNLPFREPFLPASSKFAMASAAPRLWENAPCSVNAAQAEVLADAIRKEERGWIVAGPLPRGEEQAPAIAALAEASGYPILADAASGLRFGAFPNVLSFADAWARSEAAASELSPKLVLRFGAAPSSKQLGRVIAASGARQIVLAPCARWVDPDAKALDVFLGDPAGICLGAERLLRKKPLRRSYWTERHREIEAAALQEIETVLGGQSVLGEIATARTLIQSLPSGSNLFLSNSMPIRDMDWFSGTREEPLHVFVNRGANGIDGILSSALGVTAATERPTCLLTGDLALIHDANALALAASNGLSLTIVLVNNSGGGIFHHLPIRKQAALFETYFQTPQAVDFQKLAAAFGAKSQPVESAEALAGLLREPAPGVRLLEIPVDPDLSAAQHREIWNRVQGRLESPKPLSKAVAR